MPIIVPGGTVIVPKEESAVVPSVAGSSWTERYVVDFTTEPAHDWKLNAAPWEVAGGDWAAVRMANASVAEINSNGLQMAPDPTFNSVWFSVQTAPIIYAAMTTWAGNTPLYPTGTNLQAFCMQALIEGNVTQDNNGYGMLFGASSLYTISMERMYSSAVWPGATESGYRISSSYDGGLSWSTLSSAADANTYQLFEVVIFPGSLCVASIRNETSFVDPMGTAVFQSQLAVNAYRGRNDALNTWLPDNVWPQLVVYNGALNTHTATFKKIRVVTLGVE